MKRSARRFREMPGGPSIFRRMYTRLGCQGRPPHFVVELRPYAGLTHTIRLRNDVVTAGLSDLVRGAPMPVLEAVAALLLARLYRRRTPREFLDVYRKFCYARSTHRRLLSVRQSRGRRTLDGPRGKTHDLESLFDRLNRAYFSSALPRPRLAWSKRPWRSMLGCFDPALNQIVISGDLDRAGMPEHVVQYVLYHEMLHLKHPQKFSRCRLESHSPAFRAEEKRFAHYEQARRFLAKYSGA